MLSQRCGKNSFVCFLWTFRTGVLSAYIRKQKLTFTSVALLSYFYNSVTFTKFGLVINKIICIYHPRSFLNWHHIFVAWFQNLTSKLKYLWPFYNATIGWFWEIGSCCWMALIVLGWIATDVADVDDRCFIYARKVVHNKLHILTNGTRLCSAIRVKFIVWITGHTQTPTWNTIKFEGLSNKLHYM